MTDFRALCAELVDNIHRGSSGMLGWTSDQEDALLGGARAVLAEPEPEGPTDEELMAVFWEHENGLEEIWDKDWPAAARDVLARWGGSHR